MTLWDNVRLVFTSLAFRGVPEGNSKSCITSVKITKMRGIAIGMANYEVAYPIPISLPPMHHCPVVLRARE